MWRKRWPPRHKRICPLFDAARINVADEIIQMDFGDEGIFLPIGEDIVGVFDDEIGDGLEIELSEE